MPPRVAAARKYLIAAEEDDVPIDVMGVEGVEEAKERVAIKLDAWHRDMETEGDLNIELLAVSRTGASRSIRKVLFSLSDHPATVGDALVEEAKCDGEAVGRGKCVYKVQVDGREKMGSVSFPLTFPSDDDDPGVESTEAGVASVLLKNLHIATKEVRQERTEVWDRLQAMNAQLLQRVDRQQNSEVQMLQLLGELYKGERVLDREDKLALKEDERKDGAMRALVGAAAALGGAIYPSMAPQLAAVAQAVAGPAEASAPAALPAAPSAPQGPTPEAMVLEGMFGSGLSDEQLEVVAKHAAEHGGIPLTKEMQAVALKLLEIEQERRAAKKTKPETKTEDKG